jgi:hypothetical protein
MDRKFSVLDQKGVEQTRQCRNQGASGISEGKGRDSKRLKQVEQCTLFI